ncbi:MalY/PatB family protein [Streptoverticillium reticulum]|uniref:MalY/PatB family protein n=1 Tax=Streptoverticillium reticulum TaxID=1433415 RepID=UPI0039BF7C49
MTGSAAAVRPLLDLAPDLDLDGITAESLRAAGHLKWTVSGPDLLGACAAEMDYGTAPPVTAALAEALGKGALGYLPQALADGLAEACAAWQRDSYGWDVAPADVRLLPDVVRAFHVAIDHFSRPGSPVIVPVPAFTPFLTVPGLLGREVIPVEMVRSAGRYVLDLDALDRAYTVGGHLLVLCNPHNPTGRVMETGELHAICEVVERHGGRVFADEVHAPLVYGGHRHVPYAATSPAAAQHTVTATSASKAWNLAGLKCAQMVLGNDADRDRWERLGRLATDGTSTLGAVAGTAAYRAGRPWLDAVLARLDHNRHLLAGLLAEHLPQVSHTPPEGTYLGWLDCRDLDLPGPDPATYFAAAAGVTTVDGGTCGAPGRGFVRVNFATTPEILTRIVRQLAAAAATA